jgi:hypothetical protein
MEYDEKIRNPLTDRYINLYGRTYYDLINYQYYTEEQLLSLPKIKIIKPSHQNLFEFTGIDDTDVYILSKLDDQSLVRVCQTNKRINNLCKTNKYLNERVTNYLFMFEKDFIKMKYRIARAIIALNDNKGETLQYIKKYLEVNYNISPHNLLIKKTINILTSLTSGERLIINPQHKGHYKVSKELKDAVKNGQS